MSAHNAVWGVCGAFHRLKFVNQYFNDNLLSEDVLKLLEYVLNVEHE